MQRWVTSRSTAGQSSQPDSFHLRGNLNSCVRNPALRSRPPSASLQSDNGGGIQRVRSATGEAFAPPNLSPHARKAAERAAFREQSAGQRFVMPSAPREKPLPLSTRKIASNLFAASAPASPMRVRRQDPARIGFAIQMIEQPSGSKSSDTTETASAPRSRPWSAAPARQAPPLATRQSTRRPPPRSPNSPPASAVGTGHVYTFPGQNGLLPRVSSSLSLLNGSRMEISRSPAKRVQSAATRSPQENEVETGDPFPVHLFIPLLGEGAGDIEFAEKCLSLREEVAKGSMDEAASLEAMPMPLFLDLCPRPGQG